MSDAVPERLARALSPTYTLVRELGAGGMAIVYLAHDLKHGRDVAIKVLKPDVAGALGRDRFVREIRTAARLTHPNILPLHDSGEADGFLYFVMPVMEGQTLRERLTQERRLPVDEAVRIASEVADALDYAHRHAVVHRDIKPENILLHEGHAIVADFGIGKAIAAAASETATLTQVGVTIGTPTYMSPEQAAGEPVDGRSDLFALGCVLYEMLTGEVAFAGATAQATIARRFTHTPVPVTTVRPDVPELLDAIVGRLLEKAVDDRFATGGQVVERLRTPSAPLPAMTRPSAGSEPGAAMNSLAVLPFVNLSGDADNEVFSDGLTEELLTDLAGVQALRVTSRTSSMQQKGSGKSMREIGQALGVRYVLTGSVRRAGNSLRIAAQLVDANADRQLWADKYSGTMDDVFDVQERVSRAIVHALDVTLSPEESSRLSDRPIADARAFELYLQARQELRHYNVDRALPLLERAIAIEGAVPVLRSLRAQAAVIRMRSGVSRDPASMDGVEAEARALIALVPDRAYGYALLGFLCYERGDLRQGIHSLQRALELDPADADVQFFLGISLVAAGQHEGAYRLAQRVRALDPLSPLAGMLAAVTTWFVGRPTEGTEGMERSLALAPESVIGRWTLAYHYLLVDRLADARHQADWLGERVPHLPYTLQMQALIAALEGRRDDALAIVATVDEAAIDAHHMFHLAESAAMGGDTAHALRLFEGAVDRGFFPYEFFARYCPFLVPLHGSAEFERILAKAARRVAEIGG